jgi:hypothetical protein
VDVLGCQPLLKNPMDITTKKISKVKRASPKRGAFLFVKETPTLLGDSV